MCRNFVIFVAFLFILKFTNGNPLKEVNLKGLNPVTGGQVGNNPNEMVEQITSLTEKVLGLVGMYAAQQNQLNVEDPKNSASPKRYFLAFMYERPDNLKMSGRKMTVNNNFQGKQLVPTQVFMEKGRKKDPAAPNIQIMSPLNG